MQLSTSESLLNELQGSSQPTAWGKFVRIYSPLLYAWLRRTGLQDADVDDLMQELFRVLVVKLPEFQYDRDRSFRCWLRAITLNLWRNHCRQTARSATLLGNFDDHIGQQDLFSETHYRQQVLAQAMELIKPEFETNTWTAFHEQAIENRPPADVARELGTTLGAVYVSRCRVMARLRAYLKGLVE